MGVELIEFMFEGYRYAWDYDKKCFYNDVTKKKFTTQPIGSYNPKWRSLLSGIIID